MRAGLRYAAALLVLSSACAATVHVVPVAGASAVRVPPKPPDCTIEFYEIETLQRPYDKLAEVRVSPPVAFSAYPDASMTAALREQACALGADAIVGLHTVVVEGEWMRAGTAVCYR